MAEAVVAAARNREFDPIERPYAANLGHGRRWHLYDHRAGWLQNAHLKYVSLVFFICHLTACCTAFVRTTIGTAETCRTNYTLLTQFK